MRGHDPCDDTNSYGVAEERAFSVREFARSVTGVFRPEGRLWWESAALSRGVQQNSPGSTADSHRRRPLRLKPRLRVSMVEFASGGTTVYRLPGQTPKKLSGSAEVQTLPPRTFCERCQSGDAF